MGLPASSEDAIDYWASGFDTGYDSTPNSNYFKESGSEGFPWGPNPLISSADGEIYPDSDSSTGYGLDFTVPSPPTEVKEPPQPPPGRGAPRELTDKPTTPATTAPASTPQPQPPASF